MTSAVFKKFFASPPVLFFLRCEVKVFTLSGSHQQYQSHLCESFSWKCCTSLKYFSLGLRSRKKERKKKLHTETFKAILHKRGNPGLCQDFHCQLRHILSSGRTTTQMLRRRKRRRRSAKEGVDSAVIQFTILAGAFFSLCGHGEIGKASRHWGHWLAAARHRGHMVIARRRQREEREKCTEKGKQSYRVRNVG